MPPQPARTIGGGASGWPRRLRVRNTISDASVSVLAIPQATLRRVGMSIMVERQNYPLSLSPNSFFASVAEVGPQAIQLASLDAVILHQTLFNRFYLLRVASRIQAARLSSFCPSTRGWYLQDILFILGGALTVEYRSLGFDERIAAGSHLKRCRPALVLHTCWYWAFVVLLKHTIIWTRFVRAVITNLCDLFHVLPSWAFCLVLTYLICRQHSRGRLPIFG